MPSRLRRHDESGHVHSLTISCYRRLQFFRHDAVRRAFVTAMRKTRETLAVRWLGYVVMPEHVHLLVLPQESEADEPTPISRVLHYLKGCAGRMGKEALRDIWRRDHTLGSRPLDAWATGEGSRPFWKPRGYDFNVIREKTVPEKLDYIHANPVRRGLVNRAEDWPWSSYTFYAHGDESLISMDWDGGFPVLPPTLPAVRPPRQDGVGHPCYDLTGNVSGVCPECGCPTPSRSAGWGTEKRSLSDGAPKE